MNHAYEAARRMAGILRTSGYPEAEPAPEYCIDGVIGQDGFYTYTVSVYAGPHNPDRVKPFYRRVIDRIAQTQK
jgi:hypothetical protein